MTLLWFLFLLINFHTFSPASFDVGKFRLKPFSPLDLFPSSKLTAPPSVCPSSRVQRQYKTLREGPTAPALPAASVQEPLLLLLPGHLRPRLQMRRGRGRYQRRCESSKPNPPTPTKTFRDFSWRGAAEWGELLNPKRFWFPPLLEDVVCVSQLFSRTKRLTMKASVSLLVLFPPHKQLFLSSSECVSRVSNRNLWRQFLRGKFSTDPPMFLWMYLGPWLQTLHIHIGVQEKVSSKGGACVCLCGKQG